MIRRIVQLVLVVGLLSVAWVLRPAAADPEPAAGVEPERPTFMGCIGLVERSSGAIVAVGSTVRGDVEFARVPSAEGASQVVPVGPAGGAAIDLSDIGAAGLVGVLTEMPTADAAAATVLTREGGAAAAACTPASTETVLAPGGSTMAGETLDLVLTNPYAVDAVVSVGSSSENGEDSASEIASLLVPAGGTMVRDLASLLPLRQTLTVRLTAQRGAFHASLIQTASGDVAAIEGVPPAQDWWLPMLAVRASTSRLVIATDSPLAVNVQVDVYSSGQITEAAFEGSIDPRSQLEIPLEDLGGAPLGLRISSDGPVVAAAVVDGDQTRAATPATTLSTEWVLPGSGSLAGTRAWVFNPGEVEAELVFQPLSEGAPARAVTVPSDGAVSVPIEAAGAGTLMRSSSEVAVLWSGRDEGFALATGSPLASLAE